MENSIKELGFTTCYAGFASVKQSGRSGFIYACWIPHKNTSSRLPNECLFEHLGLYYTKRFFFFFFFRFYRLRRLLLCFRLTRQRRPLQLLLPPCPATRTSKLCQVHQEHGYHSKIKVVSYKFFIHQDLKAFTGHLSILQPNTIFANNSRVGSVIVNC